MFRAEDPIKESNLLAVVDGIGHSDCYFLRVKGRKRGAFLSGTVLWNSLQIHSLRFGDIISVDVETDDQGKDRITSIRSCTDAEYESR
jgi:hypothetical protein